MVADAVLAKPVSKAKSLLTGKITGNFADLRLRAVSQRQKTAVITFGKNPYSD